MGLPLLDYAAAVALRNDGMAKVEAHSPRYSELAYAAIIRIARRQIHLHSDDLEAEGLPEPSHPNAAGPVWQRAVRDGIIQRTNQSRPSSVPKRRARLSPVYFSLIYDPRCAGV